MCYFGGYWWLLLLMGCRKVLYTSYFRRSILDQLTTNSLRLKWYKSLILPLFLR